MRELPLRVEYDLEMPYIWLGGGDYLRGTVTGGPFDPPCCLAGLLQRGAMMGEVLRPWRERGFTVRAWMSL